MDLRKEYNRYCKLYSSEPLDIIAAPLEKASYRSSAVELDLKGRGLRGVDCLALGKIMSSNTSIHHLNMSDCLLLPQGFGSLLEGLGKNGSLQILELRGNNIQSKMVENLTTFLKHNNTLKTLLLEWNCLGAVVPTFAAFCESLSANKSLEHLDLRNNLIADECGVYIGSALRSNGTLKSLDLRWNSLGIQGAKELWDALTQADDSNLRSIELTGNFVPEDVVRHIQSTLSERMAERKSAKRDDKEKRLQKEEENSSSLAEAAVADADDANDDNVDDDYEDYSSSTSSSTFDRKKEEEIATSAQKLQRTENNCQTEIKNMLTVFDDEELLLREALSKAEAKIALLGEELQMEKKSKAEVLGDLSKLRDDLASSREIEKGLRESIQAMNELIIQRDAGVKRQAAEIEARFEGKIEKVRKELESIQGENDKLSQNLKEARSCLRQVRNLTESLPLAMQIMENNERGDS